MGIKLDFDQRHEMETILAVANDESAITEIISRFISARDEAKEEINRLRAMYVVAHDRILRGDSDQELIKFLQTAWLPNVEVS